ncbi:hypothetical protein Efla_005087 [Eimeria flavescens]
MEEKQPEEQERVIPAALRRGESGRSRLLVGSEADFLPAGAKSDKSKHGRTVLPVNSELLAGVDIQGRDVPVDATAIEASLDVYSVLIEYAKLPEFAPEGIYCLPSWTDVRSWDGVVFPRHGVYRGGIFKFRIAIPKKYPNAAPTVAFLTPLFHPLVSEETGELCIQAYFKEWKSERDYLPLLLMYIKSIFFSKDLLRGTADKRNWRNETAARLFRDDKAALLQEIQQCVKTSQDSSLEAVPKEKVLRAAPPPEEREPATAANAVVKADDGDFAFNFKPFHRHLKPLLHAVSLLAVDESCVDPTEAFVEWFADDWSRAEFEKEAEKPTK